MLEVQPLRAIEYRLVSIDDTIDVPFASLDSSGNIAIGGASGLKGLFVDGTALAPSISFISDPDTGFYRQSTGAVRFSSNGNVRVQFDDSIVLGASGSLIFNSSATLGGNNDTILVRDVANTLAMKNGTAAQELRIYGTTTGPAYTRLGHDGSTGGYLYTNSDLELFLGINGAAKWEVNSSASSFALSPLTDNATPFGLISKRASNIFSVLGTFGLATNRNGDVYIGNNANTSLIQEVATDLSATNYVAHRRANGSQAARTIVAAGNVVSTHIGQAWDGANWIDMAAIQYEIDGTPGVNDMPGRILFQVTLDGSSALATGMTLNNDKVLNVVGGYKINGTAGITTTVTTGSLVGKTITFTNGLVTGFA